MRLPGGRGGGWWRTLGPKAWLFYGGLGDCSCWSCLVIQTLNKWCQYLIETLFSQSATLSWLKPLHWHRWQDLNVILQMFCNFRACWAVHENHAVTIVCLFFTSASTGRLSLQFNWSTWHHSVLLSSVQCSVCAWEHRDFFPTSVVLSLGQWFGEFWREAPQKVFEQKESVDCTKWLIVNPTWKDTSLTTSRTFVWQTTKTMMTLHLILSALMPCVTILIWWCLGPSLLVLPLLAPQICCPF